MVKLHLQKACSYGKLKCITHTLDQYADKLKWHNLFLLAVPIPNTCAVVVDITESNQRILVNQTGMEIVCLRCLNSNMRTSRTSQWLFPGGQLLAPGLLQPNVGRLINGIVELHPGTVGNGRSGEIHLVQCFSGSPADVAPTYSYEGLTLFSSGK